MEILQQKSNPEVLYQKLSEMENKDDFIKILLQDVMPEVKKLVEKEEIHLGRLLNERNNILRVSKGVSVFGVTVMVIPEYKQKEMLDELDQMIAVSRAYLSHFKNRLEEYENYALQNW